MTNTIVWFRRDLRLTDNPALDAVIAADENPVCVYIWTPDDDGSWAPGAATRWWLHHSLEALSRGLEDVGLKLFIIRGQTAYESLLHLITKTDAKKIVWNRMYDPATIERDSKIKQAFEKNGLNVSSFNASLLREPWEIENSSGKPFQVYTPFWRALVRSYEVPEPLPFPPRRQYVVPNIGSLALNRLELLPTIPWDKGFYEIWKPGEKGAMEACKAFIENALYDYDESRNRPDQAGTSRLSPHLHFGEISPNQVWRAIDRAMENAEIRISNKGVETYRKELVWREFAHHLLFHFPHTTTEPLRANFAKFPWKGGKKLLSAWQRGETGYPIIDAGMKELWHTGWMHNRVRMIVGSFLVKDLLIPWQEGAKWFWDTLVDADLANNTLGWQWISGCGADAAPYFRIFNPTLQGEKFDPDGSYVKKWNPQLRALSKQWIHRPFEAPSDVLRDANIKLGHNYPQPIVDHAEARDKAMSAYSAIKSASG